MAANQVRILRAKARLTCLNKCRTAIGEVYSRAWLQFKSTGGKQQGTEAPLPAEPLGQSAALSVSPLLYPSSSVRTLRQGAFSFSRQLPTAYPQVTQSRPNTYRYLLAGFSRRICPLSYTASNPKRETVREIKRRR